jgi:hypothetical protein
MNTVSQDRGNGGRDRDRTGDPLLAKQVLSQLSYTPTVGLTLILKHFRPFQNPFLRFSVMYPLNCLTSGFSPNGSRTRKIVHCPDFHNPFDLRFRNEPQLNGGNDSEKAVPP